MGLYALFGLLWRRITILYVLSQGFAFAFFLFTYPDQSFPAASRHCHHSIYAHTVMLRKPSG